MLVVDAMVLLRDWTLQSDRRKLECAALGHVTFLSLLS